MTRFVFITGGVVSSLGKGLTSAALGALLQARGYAVRLRKLDPYLNVDPGTMSPYEHGEVYVTDDGAETDLDLGHYERFTGVAACATDSISAGRIYQNVLERERRGDYLGRTIQVIPHVTDEIKDFIKIGDNDVDFMLCEIGGTVGDIEGLPFFEAIRQFANERPRGQVAFLHLTLVPYIAASGELKTKPTQHSVKELRSIGIQPDILVCRSEYSIPQRERAKVAQFCNVRPEAVIQAQDLDSIYQAPLMYHSQGLDQVVLAAFGVTGAPKPDLKHWEEIADRLQNPDGVVKIAIVGKYTDLEDAYKSIAEAVTHAGIANRVRVKSEWIDSEIFEREDPTPYLDGFHGVLIPGGFGVRGTEGMINAVRWARERRVPFFGICLGMQMAVIETARNLAGIPQAGSAEWDDERREQGKAPQVGKPLIFFMPEWLEANRKVSRSENDDKGATMRLGAFQATVKPGAKAAAVYGTLTLSERHRHRYEVDSSYQKTLETAGLLVSATSPDGVLPEIVERRDHPWFIGVQFHPELKSRPFAPHPLFVGFISAALAQSRLV